MTVTGVGQRDMSQHPGLKIAGLNSLTVGQLLPLDTLLLEAVPSPIIMYNVILSPKDVKKIEDKEEENGAHNSPYICKLFRSPSPRHN